MTPIIDNSKLFEAMKASFKAGTPQNYLQYAIDTIAIRYSTFGEWNNPEHDEYRIEMVELAVEDMGEHWNKFNINSNSQPFPYLAMITCHAFIKTAVKYNPDFKMSK